MRTDAHANTWHVSATVMCTHAVTTTCAYLCTSVQWNLVFGFFISTTAHKIALFATGIAAVLVRPTLKGEYGLEQMMEYNSHKKKSNDAGSNMDQKLVIN